MLHDTELELVPATEQRRFLMTLGIGVLLGAILYYVAFRGTFGTPQRKDWLREGLLMQDGLAAKQQRPKLIVVGGSSSLVGLSCETLTEQLGLPVYNLGLNAGIDVREMFFWARRVLGPGDGVVVHLELPCWLEPVAFTGWDATRAIGWNDDFYRDLGLRDRFEMVTALPPSRIAAGLLAKAHNERLVERFPARDLKPPDLPNGSSRIIGTAPLDLDTNRYLLDDNLTAFGDMLYSGDGLDPDLPDPSTQPERAFDISKPTYGPVIEFLEWCRDREIQTYVVSHPIQEGGWMPRWLQTKDGKQWLEERDKALRAVGAKVLEEPLAGVFPKQSFWDTEFHLNLHYRPQHTARIGSLLASTTLPEVDPGFAAEFADWRTSYLQGIPLEIDFAGQFFTWEGEGKIKWRWIGREASIEFGGYSDVADHRLFEVDARGNRSPGTTTQLRVMVEGQDDVLVDLSDGEFHSVEMPLVLRPPKLTVIRFRTEGDLFQPPGDERELGAALYQMRVDGKRIVPE